MRPPARAGRVHPAHDGRPSHRSRSSPPGVPQDLADLGERPRSSIWVARLWRSRCAPAWDPGPVAGVIHRPGDAPRRDGADRGVGPQEHRPGLRSAGCAARRPARRRHRPAGGSRSSRPPLPCTVSSPDRQPTSSRDSDATSPARSLGAPAASASRNPGARAGSAGRSLPAAWPQAGGSARGRPCPFRFATAETACATGAPTMPSRWRNRRKDRSALARFAAFARLLRGSSRAQKTLTAAASSAGRPTHLRDLVQEQRRRLQVPGDHGRHQAALANQMVPVASQ